MRGYNVQYNGPGGYQNYHSGLQIEEVLKIIQR